MLAETQQWLIMANHLSTEDVIEGHKELDDMSQQIHDLHKYVDAVHLEPHIHEHPFVDLQADTFPNDQDLKQIVFWIEMRAHNPRSSLVPKDLDKICAFALQRINQHIKG